MKRRFRISEQAEASLEQIASTLYPIEAIAREIVEHTGTAEDEVWRKLCLELAQSGHNVSQQAQKHGVTPHVFDDSMLRLYRECDGFIYETLVESQNAFRKRKWLNICRFLLRNCGENPQGKKVLIYGDSVGSDSIFLSRLGFEVSYHDFDSYCASFSKKRFVQHGVTVHPFSGARSGAAFDYVICLEVAEHVPEPPALVRELADLTAAHGCCIFSEGFELVVPNLPTHLKTNLRYAGKADELFRNAGMNVLWRDRDRKPVVYIKGGLVEASLRKILWKITQG